MSIKVIAGDAANTVLQIPKGVASQIQKMCRNIFHHLRYVNVVYNEEMKSGDLVICLRQITATSATVAA